MKKYLRTIIGVAALVIGPGTFIAMSYRYIWFAYETLPVERLLGAGVGAFIFAILGSVLILEV